MAAPIEAQGGATDPAVLDARIDALEQRIEGQQQAAAEIRAARDRERDEEIESVYREIGSKVFTANVTFALLAAFVAGIGVLLTLLGRRWIVDQAEGQARTMIEE